MQRPDSPSLVDSVEPPRSMWPREVRNGSAPAFQRSEVSKLFEQFLEREGRLFAASLAHREARVAFAVAVNDGDRDLLQLGCADPLADRLRRLRDLDAVLTEAMSEIAGRVEMRLAHRQHPHLHGREPERQVAAVVLEQDPNEAL